MIKSFLRLGPDTPQCPVVISVPHAGRHYPPEMETLTRQNAAQLRVLEDRHVDRLASRTGEAGYQIIVAQAPRGWIDLNRDEREMDPEMVAGGWPGAVATAKTRGGLGLVPRRTNAGGDIWRGLLLESDVRARIAQFHTPYHDELTRMLAATKARFGVAVLLDLHSMPTPAARRDGAAAHMVVGDLYGRSCDARFSWRLMDEARDAGFRAALNTPYAGGHILARHARPARGIHALQLEVARNLYLDEAGDTCSGGARAISRLVERLANALADEAMNGSIALAAE